MDTEPVTTARHPQRMDRVIVWEKQGTIVDRSMDGQYACIALEDGGLVDINIDLLRWTGTAWVIVPEHAA